MFSSVHFLFLSSLGVFSWVILCYFTQIEKYRMHPNNGEGQSNGFQYLPGPGEAKNQGYFVRDNYELYANFLCIFACIYVLAKVTNMAERYLARVVYEKLNIPTSFDLPRIGRISEDQNLLVEIKKLEKQNLQLKLELRERSNHHNRHVDPQNIYISNRQFRLNQNVYLSKDCDMNQIQSVACNGDKRNDIWMKYLEMQKKSFKKAPSPWTGVQNGIFVPVVMSSEELQNINDLWMNCYNPNTKLVSSK